MLKQVGKGFYCLLVTNIISRDPKASLLLRSWCPSRPRETQKWLFFIIFSRLHWRSGHSGWKKCSAHWFFPQNLIFYMDRAKYNGFFWFWTKIYEFHSKTGQQHVNSVFFNAYLREMLVFDAVWSPFYFETHLSGMVLDTLNKQFKWNPSLLSP